MILDEIGDEHRGRNFAIIIDEAHSSQGGKTSSALSEALADPEDDGERRLWSGRMARTEAADNASYFAFTATPKNKTLEMFGEPLPSDAEGKVKHRALSQLHDEAGDSGRLHSRCAEELYAGGQLLQAGEDGGKRSGI